MREQQEKAYAKLNLSLDVTARREDGFHELAMLMQTVSVCDELTLTAARFAPVTDHVGIDIQRLKPMYLDCIS